MAKKDAPQFGPAEGEAAADMMAGPGPSRDSKDYVLVDKVIAEADGLRLQEQVLKSDMEDLGISLEDDGVHEAHPAANRPTSDLNEDERKAEGRE